MSHEIRIKAGESLSTPLTVKYGTTLGLFIPSGWTTAGLEILAGVEGGALKPLYTKDGTQVTASPTADTFCDLGNVCASAEVIQLRSGTEAVPVAQFGVAAKAEVNFGDDRTLTFTHATGGHAMNGAAISFVSGTDDTLSAENPSGGNIVVTLANTTSSKNTAALIEGAVQALGTLANGVDVSGMTVTASAEYTATPPVGVKAVSIINFGGSKTLTFTYPAGGTLGNGVSISVENNTTDTLSVTKDAETATITIKLATTTASKNSASAIQTAVRALGAIGDYNVSTMSVGGSEAYTSAPPVGTKSVTNITYLASDGETSIGALTLTAGAAGPVGRDVMYNLIYQGMQANDTDDLSVSWWDFGETAPAYPMLDIKLANATASKNSASAIQAALYALLVATPLTGDHAQYTQYITGCTVVGDTVWDASPPITTPHTMTRDTASFVLGALPLLSPKTGTTSGGEDIPATEGILSGGDDCIIRAVLK